MIEVSFGHSRSPNYEAVVALARKADSHECLDDEHVSRYAFEHLPAAERRMLAWRQDGSESLGDLKPS